MNFPQLDKTITEVFKLHNIFSKTSILIYSPRTSGKSELGKHILDYLVNTNTIDDYAIVSPEETLQDFYSYCFDKNKIYNDNSNMIYENIASLNSCILFDNINDDVKHVMNICKDYNYGYIYITETYDDELIDLFDYSFLLLKDLDIIETHFNDHIIDSIDLTHEEFRQLCLEMSEDHTFLVHDDSQQNKLCTINSKSDKNNVYTIFSAKNSKNKNKDEKKDIIQELNIECIDHCLKHSQKRVSFSDEIIHNKVEDMDVDTDDGNNIDDINKSIEDQIKDYVKKCIHDIIYEETKLILQNIIEECIKNFFNDYDTDDIDTKIIKADILNKININDFVKECDYDCEYDEDNIKSHVHNRFITLTKQSIQDYINDNNIEKIIEIKKNTKLTRKESNASSYTYYSSESDYNARYKNPYGAKSNNIYNDHYEYVHNNNIDYCKKFTSFFSLIFNFALSGCYARK